MLATWPIKVKKTMLFAAYFDYYNFLLLRETACFARGTGQFFTLMSSNLILLNIMASL
jgi:hypothetical protein